VRKGAAMVLEKFKQDRFWRGVRQELRSQKGRFALIVGFELIAIPLALLSPVGIKLAVDCVIGSKPVPEPLARMLPQILTNSRSHLLGVAIALQLLVALLIQSNTLCNYLLKLATGEHLILNFRSRLFGHLQSLPLRYHDLRGTIDSSFRVQQDAPAIRSMTLDGGLFLVSDFAKLIAISCITTFISARLALIALAVAPFLVLYSLLYQKRVTGKYKEVQRLESHSLAVVQEALSAIRVVKAFGQENREQSRFLERALQAQAKRRQLAYWDAGFGFAVNVTIGAGTALVLFFGVRDVQSSALSLGSLLMVITYLVQLYSPLQNITYHIASLQTSSASVSRSLEIFEHGAEREKPIEANLPTQRMHSVDRDRVCGSFEFRNVVFGYSAEKPVLKHVSLRIPAGTRTALVGCTGAGKSTFVDMLVRFRDPDEGDIFLDGTNLRCYPLRELRSQFAFVLQEPTLFSATVGRNIAYGRPSASHDEIVEAAIAANAHAFISRLPQGYDTEIGERGGMISGGERQRISLARAFLKNAPILILDEPTSALDGKTEREVLEAIERLAVDRTTFFISHRLSTLRSCDIVVKLQGGRATQIPMPNSLGELQSFIFDSSDQLLEPVT
jgi:ATP-binding cassette, subfamily B, bacterial